MPAAPPGDRGRGRTWAVAIGAVGYMVANLDAHNVGAMPILYRLA